MLWWNGSSLSAWLISSRFILVLVASLYLLQVEYGTLSISGLAIYPDDYYSVAKSVLIHVIFVGDTKLRRIFCNGIGNVWGRGPGEQAIAGCLLSRAGSGRDSERAGWQSVGRAFEWNWATAGWAAEEYPWVSGNNLVSNSVISLVRIEMHHQIVVLMSLQLLLHLLCPHSTHPI